MQILCYDDLRARGIPYSKRHLWRLVKAKQFPTPFKLGLGRNAWTVEQIDSYIAERIAAASDAEAA